MITPLARKDWRNSIRGLALNHLPGLKTCTEIDASVVVYLDNELSATERFCFNVHLRICRECREYIRAYWNSIQLVRLVLDTSAEPVAHETVEPVVTAIIEERSRQDPTGR